MEADNVTLRRITSVGDEIDPMMSQANEQGFALVRRLKENWSSGFNRFELPGELFLGAYASNRLVGIGGLNRDPYVDDLSPEKSRIGRVRHVYILSEVRRFGVGAMIMREIIREAAASFSRLRLLTNTAEASAFYERLGFERTSERGATHSLRMGA